MALISGVKDVNAVHTAYRTVQEISKLLRACEADIELKLFYADLTAYCAMIRGHWNRIHRSTTRINHALYARLLDQLEAVITPDVLGETCVSASNQQVGARLHALHERWEESRSESDNVLRLERIRSCLVFGETPEARDEFIHSLATCEEYIKKLYPEDPSEWTVDDFAPPKKVGDPPIAVWNAVQSIFKALTACKSCTCSPMHEFGARLGLGTYRKPHLEPNSNMDDELDFDMFLSMTQNWHEVCVHTAKETAVRFAVNNDIGQPSSRTRGTANKSMKVKRLCEPIAKIQTMAQYRLDFKVMRGQLFKLQSKRRTSLIDATKECISLEQFLLDGSRSFTERTRRILAVILSSAVLHLHDTPWLQPTWSSSSVLFFRTASSAVPLRPFIQIQLSNPDDTHNLGKMADKWDVGNTGLESGYQDDIDPDDIDPDDLTHHQCPTLISLAVILMELYFVTPFDTLAQRYGVELAEDLESRHRTRSIDTTLVFEACRGEIPENFQFLYAVEKCLDPKIWEDAEGTRLDDQRLRTKIYEEVVRPLETELMQTYSSISINDIDEFAQNLDIASWDRAIQPWNQQPQAETPLRRSPVPRQTLSPSPQPLVSLHTQTFPISQSNFQYIHQIHQTPQPSPFHSPSQFGGSPFSIAPTYEASRFFDDETIPQARYPQACHNYLTWKSKYQEVYEKFIPRQPVSSRSAPVKIAILDTGIDLTHPDIYARIENVKGRHNWLDEKHVNLVSDRSGHGTFTAGLLLDYTPDAELYVAKIAEKNPASPGIIAAAINYAVATWNVDIISMSFGYPDCKSDDYPLLENALLNAHANHVLLFAAASNEGGRLDLSYPAREDNVIAVHATDANGNRSGFSPTAADGRIALATIGEAVESAWPTYLCEESTNPTFVQIKSGTSYATPIAAGIAAFLLLYARVHVPEMAQALRSLKRMRAILRKVAEKGGMYKPRDGYHFIDLSLYNDSLFGKEKEYIDFIIRDILSSS
ncbi:pfs domain-containing protein [Nemania sp. NC0429]|nr:pfs domain-containing protein [Nemania sp. NC0429]